MELGEEPHLLWQHVDPDSEDGARVQRAIRELASDGEHGLIVTSNPPNEWIVNPTPDASIAMQVWRELHECPPGCEMADCDDDDAWMQSYAPDELMDKVKGCPSTGTGVLSRDRAPIRLGRAIHRARERWCADCVDEEPALLEQIDQLRTERDEMARGLLDAEGRAAELRGAIEELLAASDDMLGTGWREETLGQGEEGDRLNAAWDALVAAGDPD
jgi:hypothetical protein